jgi:hypothetical protein
MLDTLKEVNYQLDPEQLFGKANLMIKPETRFSINAKPTLAKSNPPKVVSNRSEKLEPVNLIKAIDNLLVQTKGNVVSKTEANSGQVTARPTKVINLD